MCVKFVSSKYHGCDCTTSKTSLSHTRTRDLTDKLIWRIMEVPMLHAGSHVFPKVKCLLVCSAREVGFQKSNSTKAVVPKHAEQPQSRPCLGSLRPKVTVAKSAHMSICTILAPSEGSLSGFFSVSPLAWSRKQTVESSPTSNTYTVTHVHVVMAMIAQQRQQHLHMTPISDSAMCLVLKRMCRLTAAILQEGCLGHVPVCHLPTICVTGQYFCSTSSLSCTLPEGCPGMQTDTVLISKIVWAFTETNQHTHSLQCICTTGDAEG